MRALPLDLQSFPCGYFDDRMAIYDHYLISSATSHERQALLNLGYRSFGQYYFRPVCKDCERCVPIRVPLATFHPSKSQRRVFNRAADIRIEVQSPLFSQEKFDIYLEHSQRFPSKEAAPTREGFRSSFYEPREGALEFLYYKGAELVAVGLVNETDSALSSVYFFYRLAYSPMSLGTFSILKEIEYGQAHQKDFLYLGYYIHQNRFMRYKADFRPNEVMQGDGNWRAFRGGSGQKEPELNIRWPRCPSPLWTARFSQWPNSRHQQGNQGEGENTDR